MLKVLLIILLCVSMSANTNFEDIVSKVMGYHPGVAGSNEAVKAAEEGINSAMWQYFPTPAVSFSRNQNSQETTASLNQPLWTGGKLDANYNQAVSSKAESIYALDEKKYKLLETILGHAENYTQANYTKKALNDGIKRLESFSEIIDRKISVGLSSLNDKKLLESRITQIKSDLISNQFKEDIALKQISLLMGEDISSIDFLDSISFEGISSSELISRISVFNPTLKKLEEQVKSSSYEVDKQKSSIYPSLGLVAEHTRGNIYDSESDYKDSAIYFKLESSFGAGLSLLSNIEQSKIKLQKLKYEKMEFETQVIDAFWKDYNNMQVSKNKIGNYEINKSLSQDVFESNKRLYKADKKQWLDLVNSSKEVMDIDISFLSTKALYLISKYRVALQTGLIDINNGQYLNKKQENIEKEIQKPEDRKKLIFEDNKKELNKDNLIKNITFGKNEIKIDEKFISKLNKIVDFLNQNENYNLELVGHSDMNSNSNKEYNEALALKRAKSVKSWFMNNIIDSSRITILGEGFSSPVEKNNRLIGNELNRRVEFVFRNEKE